MLIINQNNEVLLLKRTSDHPLFPDEWCLPGGKREIAQVWDYNKHMLVDDNTYSESNEEAIYRECEEELGLKIHVFKDTGIFMIDDHYQMKVYRAIINGYVNVITKQFPNREHIDYDWFSKFKLPANLSKITKQLIENYDFDS